MEWIDPKYADVIAAMRRAEARKDRRAADARRVRGFLLPAPK